MYNNLVVVLQTTCHCGAVLVMRVAQTLSILYGWILWCALMSLCVAYYNTGENDHLIRGLFAGFFAEIAVDVSTVLCGSFLRIF